MSPATNPCVDLVIVQTAEPDVVAIVAPDKAAFTGVISYS